jgi:gliding motility-associated-like protein
MFFPTAFAPEGNIIKNRTFKPITVGYNKINTLRVVNRWGQTVYETREMSHGETSGWDGNYNGVKQEMGVYYWYISYKCEGKNVEDHGEVTLLR